MATDAVINDLELLGRGDAHARHVLDALAHRAHVSVLVLLQPGALAYAVVGDFQLAGLVVLHRRPLEL